MFIRKIDLLSSPPKLYIFQQKTNKTLFGGILFIIYITIMFIISFIYILNYALNDKYVISYSSYKNFTSNEEECNKNEDLNPHLNFTIGIQKTKQNYDIVDSNDFLIMDINHNFIDIDTIISATPSNMTLLIFYPCLFDCTDEKIKNITDLSYILSINYSGYKIDHQNENVPLERNNDKYIFSKELFFL